MQKSIRGRSRFFAFCISVFAGLGGLFLWTEREKEPKPGKVFDVLRSLRTPVAVPEKVVLIDVVDIKKEQHIPVAELSPAEIRDLFLTLAELESRGGLCLFSLNLEAATGEIKNERIEREFNLINANVETFFTGIKRGSIRPQDADFFLHQLQRSIQESKNRLLLATVDSKKRDVQEMVGASRLFPSLVVPDDREGLFVLKQEGTERPATETWGKEVLYSKNEDPLAYRRVYPFRKEPENTYLHVGLRLVEVLLGEAQCHLQPQQLIVAPPIEGRLLQPDPNTVGERRSEAEHPPAGAIKNTVSSPFLPLVVPLAKDGSLLLGLPRRPGNQDPFYRLLSQNFVQYREEEQRLYEYLKEMERSGYFASLDPLDYPTTRFEYLRSLEQELLVGGAYPLLEQWRTERERWYARLKDVLWGPLETSILQGYDHLVVTERLDPEGVERIHSLKELARQSFSWTRNTYESVRAKRTFLKEAVAGKFWIIGAGRPQSGMQNNPLSIVPGQSLTDSEMAATVAATILSGSYVRYIPVFWIRVGGGTAIFFAGILVTWLVPLVAGILIGFFVSLLGIGYVALFVVGGWYVSPSVLLFPVGTALVAFLIHYGILLLYQRRFLRLFRHRAHPTFLQVLLTTVEYFPSPFYSEDEIVVTIRPLPSLYALSEKPLPSVMESLRGYQQEVRHFCATHKGVFLWADGEILCFSVALGMRKDYRDEALAVFVSDLLSSLETHPWCCGIDRGPCSFSFSEKDGLFAFGEPIRIARVISSLGERLNRRLFITDRVYETLPFFSETFEALQGLIDSREKREISLYGAVKV
ncbi:MAG: hypothetical protein N2Z76_05655 [Treponemataceae bacterium]|nr:hypothetical protein [Treponemataceae bacterium]